MHILSRNSVPMEESEAKEHVQYQCMDCYEIVDVSDKSVIRCNNCGYRIFTKRRSKKPLQFEAR